MVGLILYKKIRKGRWLRREYKHQCPHEMLIHGRCQGTVGHAGNHWMYSPKGDFCHTEENGAYCEIPPGHKKYVHPKLMQKYLHLSYYNDSIIVNPEVLEKLEAGKSPEPGASIDRPCTQEEIDKFFQ